MYPTRHRVAAVLYGIVCHVTFLVGIASMILGIYTGMTIGRGPFRGSLAWAANALLLAQFPILHSLLLSRTGRAWLARLAPRGIGDSLSTTTFAIVASLQLLVVFVLWSPSGTVWWRASGSAEIALAVVYGAAWLFLLRTMGDAGMPVQTGFLGWSAVARNRKPAYGPMPEKGTFRLVRQPVYVAFTLTLWTAPVWTPDRLVLALIWTAYCIFGPLLKERRYARIHGRAFEAYRQRVPYWIPVFSARRRQTGAGASSREVCQ